MAKSCKCEKSRMWKIENGKKLKNVKNWKWQKVENGKKSKMLCCIYVWQKVENGKKLCCMYVWQKVEKVKKVKKSKFKMAKSCKMWKTENGKKLKIAKNQKGCVVCMYVWQKVEKVENGKKKVENVKNRKCEKSKMWKIENGKKLKMWKIENG